MEEAPGLVALDAAERPGERGDLGRRELDCGPAAGRELGGGRANQPLELRLVGQR